MKTIICSIFMLFLFSCEKSEYETYLTVAGIETIDSVAIYPNSPVLIADGKAQLTLMVKAFATLQHKRTVEYIVDDQHFVKDSVFTEIAEVKLDRIPASQIKIQTTDGQKIENFTFSTTQGAGGEIGFTCMINDIKSAPRSVRLIAHPQMDFNVVTIPVVFHVIYTTNNKAIADEVTGQMIQNFLDRANQVFAGTFANDPAAVDSKIRFQVATKDKNGNILPTPGINRVSMGSTNVINSDVTQYINTNLLWYPDQYLNIWVSDADTDIESYEPYYVLNSLPDGDHLDGLNYLDPVETPLTVYTDYRDLGIRYPLALIFDLNKANTGRSEHLEYQLGIHLGLIETLSSDYYPDDYCSDTYAYLKGPVSLKKYTDPKDINQPMTYYNSYNIMDQYSASTSITYEQALRIRKVIEWCPSRMYR